MNRMQHKRCSKKSGLWGISIVILVLIFIAAPLAVLIYVSDSDALVMQSATVDSSDVIKATRTLKQLYKNLMDKKSVKPHKLILSENEINSIIALAMRGITRFKGRINVAPIGIKGAFTFELSNNPFGNYINLTATIDPSPKGLVVNNLSIGSLEIPGRVAVSIFETLLNQLLTGDSFGTILIKSIKSIQVNDSRLTFVYSRIPNLEQVIEEAKRQVKDIRDELALLGNPDVIEFYYKKLCGFHKQIDGVGNAPFGYYLATVFSLAEKRSLINGEYSKENKAALLALAIFLGSIDFDSIIGAIDKETFQLCRLRGSHIVLANRNDLRLHFIYSAALKIITDSGVSFAIGEFKELLDSQNGGSGFSFADLAADRAGIRFAEQALDSIGALRIQGMASKLMQEKIFFPSILELPEEIPQHIFEERGGIESDYYKKYLSLIDHRINNLPLYKSYY